MTARVYLPLSAIAAALIATGCAELRWHKEGAGTAALGRDYTECQQQARLRAYRSAGAFVPDSPRVVGVDAQGRRLIGSSSHLDTDRLLLEHDLLGACMRGKGYALVPAEKK